MSRVIKFKAWNERLQMMCTVYSIDFDAGLVFCESEEDTRHTFGMKDVELLQFTGANDGHGVDIYDGDIVQFFDGEMSLVDRDDGGSWRIEVIDEELLGRSDDVVQIGNKYQHAELLG